MKFRLVGQSFDSNESVMPAECLLGIVGVYGQTGGIMVRFCGLLFAVSCAEGSKEREKARVCARGGEGSLR